MLIQKRGDTAIYLVKDGHKHLLTTQPQPPVVGVIEVRFGEDFDALPSGEPLATKNEGD